MTTWRILQGIVYAGLSVALIIGLIRAYWRSTWIVRRDEIKALGCIAHTAIHGLESLMDPANYSLRVANMRLNNSHYPIVILPYEEPGALAHYVDGYLTGNLVADNAITNMRADLVKFRERMINKGIWPSSPQALP